MDPSPRSRAEAKLAVAEYNSASEKVVTRIDVLLLAFRRFANSLSLKDCTQSETDDLTIDGDFCKVFTSMEVESNELNPVTNVTNEISSMDVSTPCWCCQCSQLTYKLHNFLFSFTFGSFAEVSTRIF